MYEETGSAGNNFRNAQNQSGVYLGLVYAWVKTSSIGSYKNESRSNRVVERRKEKKKICLERI